MHDILATMLNKRFMEELFKPQDAYSRKAMRTVFDRLAHASIMRLNSASMDKVQASINIKSLKKLKYLSFIIVNFSSQLFIFIIIINNDHFNFKIWKIVNISSFFVKLLARLN